MSLPQTNITTALVRNAIGESINRVFGLCSSSKINKWSRYKPITGTRPTGTAGTYGLNLPTNWNALGIVSNARLGDFRGYEHDKDLAGPVIYCESTDVHVNAEYNPNMLPLVNMGEWMIKCNQAPDGGIKILPSDLGLQNYYLGVCLHINTLYFYKTTGAIQVHDIVTGQERHFDMQILNLVSKTFADFPATTEVGNWTWYLYISTVDDSNYLGTQAWRQSATPPANYIELPGLTGETNGSKIILSRGSFITNHWLIMADAAGTSQVTNITFPYNHIGEQLHTSPDAEFVYAYKSTYAPEIGLNADCLEYYDGLVTGWFIGGHFDFQGYDGSWLPINPDSWVDGTPVQIFPISNSNYSTGEVTKDAIFGLEIGSSGIYGEQSTITLTHEDGRPVGASTWRTDNTDFAFGTGGDAPTVLLGESIGSTFLRLNFGKLQDLGIGFPADLPMRIYGDLAETDLLHYSPTVHFFSDGTSTVPYVDFTLSPVLAPADQPVIRLGNAV